MAVSALAAITMALLVSSVADRAAQQAVAQVLEDRCDAVVGAVRADGRGGPVRVPVAALDPGVVVYAADGSVLGGAAPPSLAADYAELARSTTVETRDLDEVYQLRAQPFTTAAGGAGVVVVSETTAAYEHREQLAVLTSLMAGTVMVLLSGGIAAWASKRALAPVAELARTAEAWSEHDLEQRFALGPPTNEIRALAGTLDGLLDKVAQALQSEQRLTSELAHELRTPLTGLQGTADLIAARSDLDAQLREDIGDIQRACREMSSTVSMLLDLARGTTGSASCSTRSCSLGDLVERLLANYPDHGEWVIDVPRDARLGVPVELAVRAIAPVLDNALRAGAPITITAVCAGEGVTITISDNGPGVDPSVLGDLFEPGRSGVGGSGLGLALARRVARSAGGEVLLSDPGGSERGASFEVRLPGDRSSLRG